MEEETSSTSNNTKKRKFDFAFEKLALPDKTVSPSSSANSGDFCSSEVSRCSSNESCEIVNDSFRLIDLEEKSFEIETCINNNNNNFRSRETSPSSEICGDSEEMDSSAKKPETARSNRRDSPATATEVANMPSKAEIDEFFSVAEKCEQKRFVEKYNYDIVKDVPLEGRYKWVRLNQ